MPSARSFNNNPTTQQFTAAYEGLLLQSSTGGGKEKCQQEDPVQLLHSFDDTCKVCDQYITISNAALIGKYDLT